MVQRVDEGVCSQARKPGFNFHNPHSRKLPLSSCWPPQVHYNRHTLIHTYMHKHVHTNQEVNVKKLTFGGFNEDTW